MSGEIVTGRFIKASYAAPYVAHVEMSRKPVNSVDDEFWMEFGEIFDKISQNPNVLVVVLSSGLPKIFTAGLDANATSTFDAYEEEPTRKAFQIRHHILAFQRAISATEACPFPVVAAVHGPVIGLGVDMICACDIRYTASDATFSIKEAAVGLAADIGTLARISKITGNESLVRELAYTARNFTAEEALRLGLVSNVVQGGRNDVLSAAIELAKRIVVNSPVGVVGTKHLLLHARDHTVQSNLDYTATWSGVMLQTPDLRDALGAMKSKKLPKFQPLRRGDAKL